VAVDETRILEWMQLGARREGIAVCPEAAACIGALAGLAQEGWIKPDDRVVIFNTGAAQKYPEAMATDVPLLRKDEPLDWGRIAAG